MSNAMGEMEDLVWHAGRDIRLRPVVSKQESRPTRILASISADGLALFDFKTRISHQVGVATTTRRGFERTCGDAQGVRQMSDELSFEELPPGRHGGTVEKVRYSDFRATTQIIFTYKLQTSAGPSVALKKRFYNRHSEIGSQLFQYHAGAQAGGRCSLKIPGEDDCRC